MSPSKPPRGGTRDGWAALLLLAIPVAAAVFLLRGDASGSGRGGDASATLSLVETLGGADTVGYARATEPRPFVFPADHGPHPDFRSEWWYFTGNLEGDDGARYGFQFTIFRGALGPPERASAGVAAVDGSEVASTADSSNDWDTRQVYLGHFAVTEARTGVFREFERYTRGSAGLAGAEVEPFRVWLDDWELVEMEGDPGAGDAVWPIRLTARDTAIGLELELVPRKPPVLQGDRGLSQKGSEPGNASYYYSYTRLGAEGTVIVEGEPRPVRGEAWLDREWSTSALSDGQVGWDWFALQLSDGRDVMVYQLRRADGSPDPLSKGVVVATDGSARTLPLDEFEVVPTGSWDSAIDGSTYPSGWTVRIPAEGIDLTVTPILDDQELDVSFRYWEGAVDVDGTSGGGDVTGRGYVELTGYAGADIGPRSGEG
ncbi:MAG: carotenoid 1,2-hydratase [Gemmatimonadetes bacterium]|nr:carotenoid 1,2-hydratase [Gemmatimonadota bacterium]